MDAAPTARLALAVIGVAGCTEAKAPDGQPAPPSASGPPPALVVMGEVEPGQLTNGWAFLGRVQPALSAELASAVPGHVVSVAAREGDDVRKGQVLVRLDSARARATLAAARSRIKGIETELVQARRQLQRVDRLAYPTVSEPERERFQLAVDSAEAQLETQRAETQRLRVELDQHTLKAPFDGVVRARHVDPGAWVDIGRAVVEVVSLGELEIHVDVSAELGSRLSVGDTATLLGPARASARVVGVVTALDESTRTMLVRLVPGEGDRPPWLVSGMTIDVEFEVSFEGQGVIVSTDALVRGPVDVRVVKVEDGAGVPVTVEVIAAADGRALVRGALAIGDKIVVRGNERLRPGQPVRVVE